MRGKRDGGAGVLKKNDPDSTKYIIKLLRGNTMAVTKEFFKSRSVPDIG